MESISFQNFEFYRRQKASKLCSIGELPASDCPQRRAVPDADPQDWKYLIEL
jgi:hypothetical protein